MAGWPGEKVWITNGDMADLVTVFAVTDPEKRKRGGVRLGHQRPRAPSSAY